MIKPFAYDSHEIYEGKVTVDQLFKSLNLVYQDCLDTFLIRDTKGKLCTAMGDVPIDSADIYVAGDQRNIHVVDVICYIEPQYVHQYS